MAKIVILGAGVMGSAFAVPPADLGHAVHLVGTHLDRHWIEGIRATGIHPKLQAKLPAGVTPHQHDALAAVLSGADLVVLGVSSAGVDWAIEQLGSRLPGPVPIVMLTKGLRAEAETLDILPAVVEAGLTRHGLHDVPVAGIGGPCIAGELAVRRDTSAVLAHRDAALGRWLAAIVAAPYYHLRQSADIVGVEACAALKNFFALGVGAAAGLLETKEPAANNAQMHNPAAALFTQALGEMAFLVRFLGGEPTSVHGLPGAGDLYVTCQAGRNSRMGRLLGSGMRHSQAKAGPMVGETVEGADLALAIGPVLRRLMASGELAPAALPLATAIIAAVCDDRPMTIPWAQFHQSV